MCRLLSSLTVGKGSVVVPQETLRKLSNSQGFEWLCKMLPSLAGAKAQAVVFFRNLYIRQCCKIWLAEEDGTDGKAISVMLCDVVWCGVWWCDVVRCDVVWCNVQDVE